MGRRRLSRRKRPILGRQQSVDIAISATRLRLQLLQLFQPAHRSVPRIRARGRRNSPMAGKRCATPGVIDSRSPARRPFPPRLTTSSDPALGRTLQAPSPVRPRPHHQYNVLVNGEMVPELGRPQFLPSRRPRPGSITATCLAKCSISASRKRQLPLRRRRRPVH